jgi:endonuclease YncB( thermonuclease family)
MSRNDFNRAWVLVAIAFTLLISAASADTFKGHVVGVTDGDTITVLRDDRTQVKVRLDQIDTPEIGQPFGQAAKKAVSRLVFGKDVDIDTNGLDKYGRTIGTVTLDGEIANYTMVKTGYAWAYRKYLRNQDLLVWEENARNQRLGLWADPHPMPPWEWRKKGSAASPMPESFSLGGDSQFHEEAEESPSPLVMTPTGVNPTVKPEQQASPKCGKKRFCKEMSDCTEAHYYLTECGLTKLDGDGDGIPCENVCGF